MCKGKVRAYRPALASARNAALRRRFVQAARYLVALLVTLVLVATVLPMSRSGAWWIRVFDFPRVQVLSLALLTTVALLVLPARSRRWKLLGLLSLLACGVLQSVEIVPYTPLWPTKSENGSTEAANQVSMLVANVKMENREPERLLAVIEEEDPDIIVIVEPDSWWQEQLQELEVRWPHTISAPLPNTYGMLVYSRLALHGQRVRYLVEADIPSAVAEVELPSGARFDLHVVHPKPPAPAESKDTDERDAELLIVGDLVADRDRPSVVAGDLNDVAWSGTTHLFLEISGLLDPRIGRGLYSSFHADHWFLRWPLDHVFHSEHFLLTSMRRLPAIGSDHFPILVRLALTPIAEEIQERPRPEAEDRVRAKEKIQQGTAK